MPNLLFIHGIGVRGEAWFRGFELISRKAKYFLPGVKVHGCQWGDAFGSRLHKSGATIPGYLETGNARPLADDASRARWFLLADDPLLELRILPEETYIGEIPGMEIYRSIPPLGTSQAVLDLLKDCSVADLWPGFIASPHSWLPEAPARKGLPKPGWRTARRAERLDDQSFGRAARGNWRLAARPRDEVRFGGDKISREGWISRG